MTKTAAKLDINSFITEDINNRAVSALTATMTDSDAYDAAGDVLELGAPLIVAAVLRRMAEVVGPQRGVEDGSDPVTRRACAAELMAAAGNLELAAQAEDHDTDGIEF